MADFVTNFAPLKEWQQHNLLGEKLEIPQTPEAIKSVCCRRCFTAKHERCKCHCKGAFHGLGNKNKVKGELNDAEKERKSLD